MKRITTFAALFLIFSSVTIAQHEDFEGILTYKIEVKSKIAEISDGAWRNILGLGETMTVTTWKGNTRQTSGASDIYSITKDQRVYFRFKGIDTLYYLDYSSDTTSLIDVSRSGKKRNLAGYDCNAITIKTPGSTKKYFYSPAIYVNPEHERNNKIGRTDVFVKETSSLYLGYFDDNSDYTLSQTCLRLKKQPVDKSIFEMPVLPQKEFTPEAITVQAQFPGRGGFERYLTMKVNPEIGYTYVKIKEGENSATETVWVLFMVTDEGAVKNVSVVNEKEVHPKLSAEALRAVTASPAWTPCSVLGQKVLSWMKIPITFLHEKS
jgi:Gram-negative bacterial TonB protein C-terminal